MKIMRKKSFFAIMFSVIAVLIMTVINPIPSKAGQVITIDGNASEWAGISAIVTADGQSTTSLKIKDDEDYLYFCIQGSGMGSYYDFLINADNDTATGYISDKWSSSGCDFLIENGILYRHPANSPVWDGAWVSLGESDLLIAKNSSICEMRVAKTALTGLGTAITAGYIDKNSNWTIRSCIPASGVLPKYTLDDGKTPAAPVISSVSVSGITQAKATVKWTTDTVSNSVAEYGTSTLYGSTSERTDNVTSHSVALTGLKEGTTYHFRVKSTDSYGQTSTSGDYTFTTSSGGTSNEDFYVSKNGNDRNPGTKEQPWKTIQKACNTLQPGQTAYIREGVYNEKVAFYVSGSADGGYITIRNYPGETPILDGAGISGTNIMFITQKSYIKVIGLEIRNNSGQGITGINIDDGSDYIEIRNCKIHDIKAASPTSSTANPLYVLGNNESDSNSNIIIDGNEIYDCATGWAEAVTINGNSEYWQVTNNKIHDTGNIGIDAAGHFGECSIDSLDQARNGLISGNTVYNCNSPNEDGAAAGIYVDGGKDIIIERNTVHHSQHGLSVGCENHGKTTSGIIVRNNLIYKNTRGGLSIGGYNINIAGSVINTQVYNNTLYKNNTERTHRGDLNISVCDDVTIKNNIIYGIGGREIIYRDPINDPIGTVVMDHNVYFSEDGNNTKFQWGKGSQIIGFEAWKSFSNLDSNSCFKDPGFKDPEAENPDFHVLKYVDNNPNNGLTPAIDTGDPDMTSATGETDLDGKPRLSGTCIDCGAYEYQ